MNNIHNSYEDGSGFGSIYDCVYQYWDGSGGWAEPVCGSGHGNWNGNGWGSGNFYLGKYGCENS